MTHCSGICIRFKHIKKQGDKWYGDGVKRCNFCKVFMKTSRRTCPCCKTFLRTQGRGSDVKATRDVTRIEA